MNPEVMRQVLLEGLELPKDLLQEAFNGLRRHLNAKKRKHFTFRGRLISSVDVEDTTAQAAAQDKVFSLAGLYARAEARHDNTQVALEVDSKTGIIRLVVGGASGSPGSLASSDVPAIAPETPLALTPASPTLSDELDDDVVEYDTTESPVEFVRVPRGRDSKGKLPDEVRRILFGDHS